MELVIWKEILAAKRKYDLCCTYRMHIFEFDSPHHIFLLGNGHDRNSNKKNCVTAQGSGDECELQNDFFSILFGSGNFCSGNEFKIAAKNACGCKPNSVSPCAIEFPGCAICTAEDFFNGDEACNDCRDCLEICSSITDCFNNAASYLDFAACFDTIDDSCRASCAADCTKD